MSDKHHNIEDIVEVISEIRERVASLEAKVSSIEGDVKSIKDLLNQVVGEALQHSRSVIDVKYLIIIIAMFLSFVGVMFGLGWRPPIVP